MTEVDKPWNGRRCSAPEISSPRLQLEDGTKFSKICVLRGLSSASLGREDFIKQLLRDEAGSGSPIASLKPGSAGSACIADKMTIAARKPTWRWSFEADEDEASRRILDEAVDTEHGNTMPSKNRQPDTMSSWREQVDSHASDEEAEEKNISCSLAFLSVDCGICGAEY